jgi:hypothetical protein
MALVLTLSIVIALLGALAQLALDYPLDSRDLERDDRDRAEPMWFAQPRSAR